MTDVFDYQDEDDWIDTRKRVVAGQTGANVDTDPWPLIEAINDDGVSGGVLMRAGYTDYLQSNPPRVLQFLEQFASVPFVVRTRLSEPVLPGQIVRVAKHIHDFPESTFAFYLCEGPTGLVKWTRSSSLLQVWVGKGKRQPLGDMSQLPRPR